jgi:hypothetical protein
VDGGKIGGLLRDVVVEGHGLKAVVAEHGGEGRG